MRWVKQMKLSKRLTQALHYVSNHHRLIDVGSDHAHLAIKASEEYGVKCIAIDNKIGPFQKSLTNVQASGLNHVIDCRLQDGLTTCDETYDVISICGMGGILICDILDHHDASHSIHSHYLVLQPNTHIDVVRRWLNDHKFRILEETILEENKKLYEVIYATYDQTVEPLEEIDLLFGPKLRNEKHPLFLKKYESLLLLKKEALKNINKDATNLRNQLMDEIAMLERGLYEN